jgi:UDP-2-acetamido-2,6-beta-L-arabino-hexul-4-ose reductase
VKVLITGANGFVGKNLISKLKEFNMFSIETFCRGDQTLKLIEQVGRCDVVIHLAGANRPQNDESFNTTNIELTRIICDSINKEFTQKGRKIKLFHASSAQATLDTPYGKSKYESEELVKKLSYSSGLACCIYRFPGIFGKWCRPNYNSVVATFCYNVSRGIPIHISAPEKSIKLIYIDDVINEIVKELQSSFSGIKFGKILPEYEISLGELAEKIQSFKNCRKNLIIEKVGYGLDRALYSTYISHFSSDNFTYKVEQHHDERGMFVEMLKTHDSGQFSFFTANPGVTRGGHYHHSKTEKFLVLHGEALFRFQHILNGEVVEIKTSGKKSIVVDTIPGWAHNVTNIGKGELIIMLWANEIFDKSNPDTIMSQV